MVEWVVSGYWEFYFLFVVFLVVDFGVVCDRYVDGRVVVIFVVCGIVFFCGVLIVVLLGRSCIVLGLGLNCLGGVYLVVLLMCIGFWWELFVVGVVVWNLEVVIIGWDCGVV